MKIVVETTEIKRRLAFLRETKQRCHNLKWDAVIKSPVVLKERKTHGSYNVGLIDLTVIRLRTFVLPYHFMCTLNEGT